MLAGTYSNALSLLDHEQQGGEYGHTIEQKRNRKQRQDFVAGR
jgi:hypothetical protein